MSALVSAPAVPLIPAFVPSGSLASVVSAEVEIAPGPCRSGVLEALRPFCVRRGLQVWASPEAPGGLRAEGPVDAVLGAVASLVPFGAGVEVAVFVARAGGVRLERVV